MTQHPRKDISLFDGRILRQAVVESLKKLSPRVMIRNPVMFIVEVGSTLTTGLFFQDIIAPGHHSAPLWFTALVSVWLWFTVLFANFAEAVAEGRGKAQADSLRRIRKDTLARLVKDGTETEVSSTLLARDDSVVVRAGEVIPGDGEVIEASLPLTSPLSPVNRPPLSGRCGGDRSAVTGGTRVLSDRSG